MEYEQLLELIKNMKIGESKNIYRVNNVDIWIFRPEKLGSSLKNKDKYNIQTNFQIFMRDSEGKAFKPNHLEYY